MSKYLFGVLTGLGAILSANYFFGISPFINSIPKTEIVQEGFIAPNRMKIFTLDTNKDGIAETIVLIDKEPYALIELNNMPMLFGDNPKGEKSIRSKRNSKDKRNIEPYRRNLPVLMKRGPMLANLDLESTIIKYY